MPAEMNTPKQPRGINTTHFLVCTVLIIGILYFGREIFIPLAFAILLTFILSPVVSVLRRWGTGRIGSVVITVALTLALLASVATMITVELKSLANELPAYRQNIRKKISDIRSASKSESLRKVKDIAQEIVDEFKQDDVGKNLPAAPETVVVTEEKKASTSNGAIFDSIMGQLSTAGLVVILVIFMLLRREDMRDRLLHIVGCNNLIATTKAIEEASRKVSSYLVRQCLLNALYGVGISIGLSLIGLPYAFLWGFLAGIARFIPYVGPVLGAICPMLVSLAVFNTWGSTLFVVALILGWELLNNLVLEPVIYGQGIGVSEVALLLMMAFWTWLWGPLGLIMAAPLTVCIVVISKSVPGLGFFSLLLSSKPALSPPHALYQRLIAQNRDEALTLTRTFLKKQTVAEYFETLLLPVLQMCRHDHAEYRLSDKEQESIFQMIRELLPEVHRNATPDETQLQSADKHPLIIGCPARDGADEIVLMMLAELLSAQHCYMPVISSDLLDIEKIGEIADYKPMAICVSCLPNVDAFPYAEYCAQIQQHFPSLPIVAGCWGEVKPSAAGPIENLILVSTLAEAQQQLLSLRQPAVESNEPDSALPSLVSAPNLATSS